MPGGYSRKEIKDKSENGEEGWELVREDGRMELEGG